LTTNEDLLLRWFSSSENFVKRQHLVFDAFINYPNVTTLRSGICYRKSICRL